jgi:hypothetical protein
MESFANWLLKLEIGMVPEPDKPERPWLTALPTVTLDGSDLPPTTASNARQRKLIQQRRMRKRMKDS